MCSYISLCWLLCFSLCVCEAATSRFVKAPIMMMICSLQWLYLDDLISSLSVGRRKKIIVLFFFSAFFLLLLLLLLLLPWRCIHPRSDKTLLWCIPAVTAWHGLLNPCHSVYHTHTHACTQTHILHASWKSDLASVKHRFCIITFQGCTHKPMWWQSTDSAERQ